MKKTQKTNKKKLGKTDKNITWQVNQKIIHETYLALIGRLKRCPTIGEVCEETKLSRNTLDDHIKELQFDPPKSPLRVLTPDIIAAIYSSARKGSSASQKLWLQVMEGWSEKTDLNMSGNFSIKNIDIGKLTDAQLSVLKQMITSGKSNEEITAYLKMADFANE